ncbi:hypothetical protein HRED_02066 [Candidatus Haloredivivus sp. G17]|nr:hypothetical protein HRED_02066 [Candidatus Haloredivivus sp. G17]
MGKSSGVKERPKVATGTTQEIETAYGDLFVTVNNSKHNGPVEIFAQIGKEGGDERIYLWKDLESELE